MPSRDDPIDAVLAGEPGDEDLLDVATVVHDVRAAYLDDVPVRRDPRLAAFTECRGTAPAPAGTVPRTAVAEAATPDGPDGAAVGDAPPARRGPVPLRSRARRAARGPAGSLARRAALVAVVVGGGTGALHTAGAVDLPGLPDGDEPPVEVTTAGGGSDPGGDGAAGDGPPGGTPSGTGQGGGSHRDGRPHVTGHGDSGGGGQATAEARRDAARQLARARQLWSDCVADAAAGRGGRPLTGTFDPAAACGHWPRPRDYGLGEPSPPSGDGPGATWPDGDGPEAGGAADQGRSDPSRGGGHGPAGRDTEDGDAEDGDGEGRGDEGRADEGRGDERAGDHGDERHGGEDGDGDGRQTSSRHPSPGTTGGPPSPGGG